MEKANLCGERIKDARKQKGLGQVDLSAALDIDYGIKMDQSDISEIERGARGIKDYELNAIAEILDVSLEWLVRGQ